MRFHLAVATLPALVLAAQAAAALDMRSVNDAQWQQPSSSKSGASKSKASKSLKAGTGLSLQLLLMAQVLLVRAHFSPGEVDGKAGENLKKALTAFAGAQGLESKGDVTD